MGVQKRKKHIGWDESFMDIVAILARRPHCIHHQVACVLVDQNHRIISTGYNGPSSGNNNHCDDLIVGCSKDKGNGCRGLHAEDNAMRYVKGSLIEVLQNATCYCLLLPCPQCMKNLLANGVKRIVFAQVYKRVARPDEKEADKKSDYEIALGLVREYSGVKVDIYNNRTKTTTSII